jgi:hypothetical protein
MKSTTASDTATQAAFAGGFIASVLTLVLYRALGVTWAYQTPLGAFGGGEVMLSVHYVVLIWWAVVLIWAVSTKAKHFAAVAFALAVASIVAPSAFALITA